MPVPVLGDLLLTAETGRPTVSGLDFETAARVGAEAEVAAPGGRRRTGICS
jgi:DNA polymerase-3 subunit beta